MAARSSVRAAPPVGSIPAVPGLPLVGNWLAFRRDRLALLDQAARLGPIARISMGNIPLYIVTCGDLAHDVLVEHDASFQKSVGVQFMRPLLGDGLLTAEGDHHRRHRKLLAPAFAPRRLASYGEVMVAETREQIARWRPGDRIDLAAEMMQMTLAIAARTLFGVDIRRDARTVARAVALAAHAIDVATTSPLQLDYRWPLPRHVRLRRAVAMLDDVVYRLIRNGRALGSDRGDVLSMLVLARDEDDGSQLADREIRDEVMTLLLAGHETTSNTLSWTWYELGRHPEALARLEAEVARVLGGRPVTTADLPALPWTAAVIDETMRLHPPVYMTSREALREVEIGGHRLPVRSIVAINIRGIHRRADPYPEPLAFRPERMLPDAKKPRPRHHYLPFGAGPRVCIGAHFALMEAQLALATMVAQARLHLLAHTGAVEPLVTQRPRGGLPAIVQRC